MAKVAPFVGVGVVEEEVGAYGIGDFFGELALLNDVPRAASVYADGDCTCKCLHRDTFVRLLGPCEDILKRSAENYMKHKKEADEIEPEPPVVEVAAPAKRRARRGSVSAECFPTAAVAGLAEAGGAGAGASSGPAKTAEEVSEIKSMIGEIFLFNTLEGSSQASLVDGFVRKTFAPGDEIITQGAEGDFLYLISSGSCQAFVDGKMVTTKQVLVRRRGLAPLLALLRASSFLCLP